MTSSSDKKAVETIRSELEATRASFHALLDSLTEDDWRKPSLNPGWTNGEILAHMLVGFISVNVLLPLARVWGRFPESTSRPLAWLLNAATGPSNWFNALGARMQGRVFTHKRIGDQFDRVDALLLKNTSSIKENEWGCGMYYPTKWDSNFSEFMTIAKLLRYPVIHFNYHLSQISR